MRFPQPTTQQPVAVTPQASQVKVPNFEQDQLTYNGDTFPIQAAPLLGGMKPSQFIDSVLHVYKVPGIDVRSKLVYSEDLFTRELQFAVSADGTSDEARFMASNYASHQDYTKANRSGLMVQRDFSQNLLKASKFFNCCGDIILISAEYQFRAGYLHCIGKSAQRYHDMNLSYGWLYGSIDFSSSEHTNLNGGYVKAPQKLKLVNANHPTYPLLVSGAIHLTDLSHLPNGNFDTETIISYLKTLRTAAKFSHIPDLT